MSHNDKLIADLEKWANQLRQNCLTIFSSTKMGHGGGTMSIVELITTLYFHHLRFDPKNVDWAERDRLVLSKAHCCEVIYAALVELGVFPCETLETYYRFGSPFQGHADRWCTPGIDYSGGSLGQGLSFAAGMALAEKRRSEARAMHVVQTGFIKRYIVRDEPTYRSYCILGDGELHEGMIWEAAMFAAQYKLDNLIAIVDYNKFSLDGPTNAIMNLEPLVDKWKAFGWWVTEIDGHDLRQVADALDLASRLYGDYRPKCIIAHTVKGHGIPAWEAEHMHLGRGEIIVKGCQEGREIYADL